MVIGKEFFRVREVSGKRPFSAAYAHGVLNSLIPFFPILILQEGDPQLRFWIWVGLTLVVGILLTVLRQRSSAFPIQNTEGQFGLHPEELGKVLWRRWIRMTLIIALLKFPFVSFCD